MLTRRGFIGALSALAAGLTLDPERLLWVPGAKTIVMPPAQGWVPSPAMLAGDEGLHAGDMITIEGIFAINPVTRQKTDVLQYFTVTDITPRLGVSLWPPRPLSKTRVRL